MCRIVEFTNNITIYLSIFKQLSLPWLAVSVLYFEKELGIGCENIRKFVNSTHNFSYEKPVTLIKLSMNQSWACDTLPILMNKLGFIDKKDFPTACLISKITVSRVEKKTCLLVLFMVRYDNQITIFFMVDILSFLFKRCW